MCKECGYKIEQGKFYSTEEIFKLKDGRKIMRKIADCHFKGEKVFTAKNGFCGSVKVVDIIDAPNNTYVFMMVDEGGCLHHFSEDFAFEIRE